MINNDSSVAYGAMVSYENSSKGTNNTVIVFKPPMDITLLPGAVLTEEEQQLRLKEKSQTLMYSTRDSAWIDSIFKHIVQNEISVFRVLFEKIGQDEYLEFARILITFSIGCNNVLRILRYFIHSDLKQDPNNLYKNYSLSNLLISQFLEKQAPQYFKDVLRQFLIQVIQDKALNLKAELQSKNINNLTNYLKQFTTIMISQDSIDKLPIPIKVVTMIFNEIWPHDDSYQGVSTFLINKLFVPVLSQPESFGLLPKQVQMTSRAISNLNILAKSLSHCLTGYEYEGIDNELLNPLKVNLRSMIKETQYYKSVLAARFSTSSYQYLNEASMSQLHFLHRTLSQNRIEIKSLYQQALQGEEFDRLMNGLMDYQFRITYQFLTPSEVKSIKSHMESINEEITFIGYLQKLNKKQVWVKRILVVGIYKILTFKMNGKLGREGHILNLQELNSSQTDHFEMMFKQFKVIGKSEESDHVITCIRRIYEYNLNNWPYQLKMKLKVSPQSRLEAISPPDHTPTSSMVSAYKCLCSFYQIPVKKTICWYIENAFSDPSSKIFNLKIFTKHTREPPTNQDLIPIIHSLRYDWFFEELVIKNYKIDSKDLIVELSNLLNSNSTITSLTLSNLQLPKEYLMVVFDVIQNQKSLKLTSLDISNNPTLDDKSLNSFFSYLQYGQTQELKKLKVSNTNIQGNNVKSFFDNLKRSNLKSLESLDISSNKLLDQLIDLSRWLSNEGSNLQDLNLSDCSLKSLSNLQLSSVNTKLETLNISKNLLKSQPDLIAISNLLKNLTKLKSLELTNCNFASDQVKELLSFLTSSNSNVIVQQQSSNTIIGLRKLNSLNLSGNSSTRPLVTGLIQCLAINYIKVLDLSDNDLTDGGIKELGRSLYGNNSIISLNISGSFRGSSGLQRSKAMLALSNYISSSTTLESLIMKGGQKTNQQLQRDIVPFLLSLGSTFTLKHLDISWHSIGNQGAISLAKALYQNKSITNLVWDNNNVGSLGYANIKNSLKQNYTIKEMNIPIYDITEIYKYDGTTVIEQKKLRSLLLKMESYLSRNQSL
ncbi:RasGTPase-activating protein [Tieghemostelium lacteum]|uniref:RasGTPase-activating protein n=1 Tax=Tieghemostelium lacteum TaxID=361077 RepID=A0A152A8Y2_TIELA|nr:RasGTPase-activating protein [Tieghemostelium lacteum]|eukprot:KYR02674.1 RasGTPase-activating protein [Tieghemostelium lacteum]